MLAPMPRARRLFTAAAALALAAGLVGAPALASAHPMRDAAPAPVDAIGADGLPSRASDTSAFTFDSFDAVYTLGRTASENSTLRTVETLVAEFPSYDQNRGIIRAIPVEYDGHPTQIKILSVTDGTGAKRSYDAALDSNDNSFYDVTIAVPKGQFVHGKQTYVNKTGNPGMATGGTGDLLAGMIGALIGQKLSPYDAACLGDGIPPVTRLARVTQPVLVATGGFTGSAISVAV